MRCSRVFLLGACRALACDGWPGGLTSLAMTEPSPPPESHTTRPNPLERVREALAPGLEVKRELGRGSMATVYLAREAELDRLVAVKVLHSNWAADETARRRFEREARSAASLAHPNVVEVFRFGRLPDETPYLVMRFVKGRTLEERLKAEGRLPVDLTRNVLIGVASALEAAHEHGIVHRDVRPANVLWDEQRDVALLTDFGIAALLDTGGEEVTRLTKTGQMVGDPRYLSPEQLLDEPLTELGDMYSFGVMGYELLTGSGPYDAKTNMQWIRAHLSSEIVPLTELRPDADAALASVLARCLAREPNHRPNAADVVRMLSGEGEIADAGSFATPRGSDAGDPAATPTTVPGRRGRDGDRLSGFRRVVGRDGHARRCSMGPGAPVRRLWLSRDGRRHLVPRRGGASAVEASRMAAPGGPPRRLGRAQRTGSTRYLMATARRSR